MGKKSLVHKKRVIFTPSAKFHGIVIFYPKTNSKFPWQQSFCLYALFVFGPENSKLCISPGDAIFFPSGCAFCILSIVRDQHGRVCVSMGFNPMDRPNRSTFLMENHGLFKPARLITGRVIIAHSIPSEIYIRNKVIFSPNAISPATTIATAITITIATFGVRFLWFWPFLSFLRFFFASNCTFVFFSMFGIAAFFLRERIQNEKTPPPIKYDFFLEISPRDPISGIFPKIGFRCKYPPPQPWREKPP